MLHLHQQQLINITVITLFDTGANPTSSVNSQVAAWIESQQSQRTPGKRKHSSAPTVSVALAGTSHTCPIYGSVVFKLTFFNEVTRSHLPLACKCHRQLHRYHCRPPCNPRTPSHTKLPHYFDETTSSRPDLSQSVTPVTPSFVSE